MTTVDNYKISKTLGKGAFSLVKLAYDEEGEKIALKLIDRKKNKTVGEEVLTREVDCMTSLDHPNILKCYGFSYNSIAVSQHNKTKEVAYIALEYATHGELFEYLVQTGPFGEDISRYYFTQLIDALKYIHDCGFSHRDIKLDNLLLDQEFNLKVGDFGFATKKSSSKSQKGTISYMAPEVLHRETYDCQNVDLYAAAIVLFNMVSHHTPFEKADESDKLYKLISERKWEEFWSYHEQKKFSEEFKDLFSKLVDPDQNKRLTIKHIRSHNFMQKFIPTAEEILKNFSMREQKLKKKELKSDKKKKDEKKFTKFYKISDGDELLDAVIEVCNKSGMKCKKSKDVYKVKIRVGKRPFVTKITVNVLKMPDEEKRCLEFVKVQDQCSGFDYTFNVMKEYLDNKF